jgi:opacity protein-like surface antigen
MIGRGERWAGSLALVAASLVALAAMSAPALGQGSGAVTDSAHAAEKWRPRPVRNGTVSLGGAALYGTLFGGQFSDEFKSGLGVGFNIRYRTAPDQALGLGFDSQIFAVKTVSDSAAAPDRLQFIVTTFDYYKFFSVRKRMPAYLVLGAGIAQTRITDVDGEKEFPGDGGAFKVGAGLEYWIFRSMTLDAGVRYHGLLLQSQLNHQLQATLGLNFYASP